jgi:hypothetical protein
MRMRWLSIAGWLLAAGWFGAVAMAQPGGPPRGGARKGGVGLGPSLPRPDGLGVVDRLERMTPQQRQRYLDTLPPDRRKQFEDRLGRYEQMTPEQRQQVREQYELFQGLSEDQQDALRRTFRQFNELPDDRRKVLRREYQRLSQMTEIERSIRVESKEFLKRYSSPEQQLLKDFATLLPAPKPVSPPQTDAK